MSRRDTSPVEGRHQADTLSRRDKSSVETAFPTDPTTPLLGQNMSRRDKSSVGTAFTDGSHRPFRGKTSPPPPPIVPVQIPKIDGLAQMSDLDVRAAVEVSDGADHLQDVGR